MIFKLITHNVLLYIMGLLLANTTCNANNDKAFNIGLKIHPNISINYKSKQSIYNYLR